MENPVRRTVVVSAVSICKGGTLTILRDCLRHLSGLCGEYRVVALVNRHELFDFEGIEYIEFPGCSGNWIKRFWAEYVTMHRISLELARQDGRKVWTWLSLHDTTPRVEAECREVYCQTSFPFLRLKLRDFRMDPKLALLAILSGLEYRINARKNDCFIVQQEWFADGLSKKLEIDRSKFRVIAPQRPEPMPLKVKPHSGIKTFLYVSTPDCHKNFECLCEAAALLEKRVGTGKFRVIITVRGDENRYARFLRKHWGDISSIDFHGFIPREELPDYYASADCLVFPSRIETWGLPISEYMAVNPTGALILADLPYAHETSEGRGLYFDPSSPASLSSLLFSKL